MKKIAIPAAAVAISLLLTSLAPAGTVNIPKDEPVISVSIPDSWKPEETDKGITCESPDQVATVIFEVTSAKGANALVDENIDWLVKDQGIQIDAASKTDQNFETAGLKWAQISWSGNSKEWGPAAVGFVFTHAGNGKMVTVTYWISKKGSEKDKPVITTMFDSVKLIGG